jgi:hypothetical protein
MAKKAESKKSKKFGVSFKINPIHRKNMMGFLGPTTEEQAEEEEGIVYDEPIDYALGIYFDPKTRRRRLPLHQKLTSHQKHVHSVGAWLASRKVKPESKKKSGKKKK